MYQIQKVLMFIFLFVFSFWGLFTLLTGKVLSLDNASSIIITEVMPDPKGTDSLYEWVEIKNISTTTLNLKEWQLNGSTLTDIQIKPKEIIILAHDVNALKTLLNISNVVIKTTVNLNNAGSTLEIKRGVESNKFTYPKAKENITFELLEGNCGTIQLNPNGNSIGKVNNSCNTPAITNPNLPNQVPSIPLENQKMIISKVCPFPTGGFEFLEIKNTSSKAVNISNWLVYDSKNNDVLPSIEIQSQKSYTLYPKKVTLNNDGDKITITNASKTYSNSLTYPKAKENECFTPDSLKTILPNVIIKADTSTSGPLISIKKDTTANTQGKIGYKIELKIPRLFRIQFSF